MGYFPARAEKRPCIEAVSIAEPNFKRSQSGLKDCPNACI